MLRLATCVLLAAAVVGCQPLYGAKPEKLSSPPKKKVPPEAAVVADAPPKLSEDCAFDFRGDPAKARPQVGQGQVLTSQGDSALVAADRATDPATRGGLIKDGIDKLRGALMKDPYSAEATLKLALAYDRVYKKGCALALLKRLAALANNSMYAKAANLQMGAVDDNSQWFKYYRKDALAAIGH